MAGRGEADTGDWLFSGGRPASDVRPGLVPNSTKAGQHRLQTPYTCFHLKSHSCYFFFFLLSLCSLPIWLTLAKQLFLLKLSHFPPTLLFGSALLPTADSLIITTSALFCLPPPTPPALLHWQHLWLSLLTRVRICLRSGPVQHIYV